MRVERFGQVTLYQGDALEILPQLSGVDALVADPPYSSGGMTRGDRMDKTANKYQGSGSAKLPEFEGDTRDQRAYLAWSTLWMGAARRAMNPGAVAYVFTDWRQLPTTTDALQCAGFVWRGIVPWDKLNARPQPNRPRAQCEFVPWGTNGPRSIRTEGATYHPGILAGMAPPTAQRIHMTQKPVGVIEELVKIAPPGGLVLDPFLGSGTTALAAINTGRRFVGVEVSPFWFDEACRRIEAASLAAEARP